MGGVKVLVGAVLSPETWGPLTAVGRIPFLVARD